MSENFSEAVAFFRQQALLVSSHLDNMFGELPDHGFTSLLARYLRLLSEMLKDPPQLTIADEDFLLSQIKSALAALPPTSLATDQMTAAEARALLQRMDDLGRAIHRTYRDGLGRTMSEAQLAALNDLRNNFVSYTSAQDVVNAAASLQEAAGEVAESELAEEFSKLSETEARLAALWTTGAIVALAGAAIIASVLLATSEGLSLGEELARLSVTLPVAAIAAYAARIAAQHRKNGHWARITAVQLKSVRAYGEDLSESLRHEVRKQLAETAFGKPPIFDGRSLEASPVEDVNAVLDRALAVIRSSKT
jgi:hypothetical protein